MTDHPIDRLHEAVLARRGADSAASYTAKLFQKGTERLREELAVMEGEEEYPDDGVVH